MKQVAIEPAAHRPNHHLVLHFDINETILIGDEAGGDTREESFHKMLAKSSFVRLGDHLAGASPSSYADTEHFEPTHWWNGLPIRDRYSNEEVNHQRRPPLFTGWTWPKGCCPYYRTKFKARAKNFIQHHGSVYREVYEELQAKLLPETQGPNLHGGLLIPAFWETLVRLGESSEPLTLVFRTFGTDLPNVAQAVSAFARGQHPQYPHIRNENLAFSLDQILQGKWATVNPSAADRQAEYQLWNQQDELVASGDAAVVDYLHQQTVCGIRDDYTFWKENNWEPWAGKPVWTFPAHDPDSRFHHLLFDDNIHHLPHDGIASVRQKVMMPDSSHQEGFSYRTLSGEEILQQHGTHLIRVPTVAPILNPLWFVEEINKAQAQYASKMAAS